MLLGIAIDPGRIVDAAGTLRRIAFRVGNVSDVRLQTPTPPLASETQAARDAFEAELRARLQSWLDYVKENPTPTSRTAIAWAARRDSAGLGELLTRYTDRISASGYAEVAVWPPDTRIVLLGEIESFDRLVVLAGELDFAGNPALKFAPATKRRLYRSKESVAAHKGGFPNGSKNQPV